MTQFTQRLWTLFIVVTTAVATLFALRVGVMAPATATAADFHGYSVAGEVTGDGFTGVSVRRIDQSISGIPSVSCSSPFGIDPVYQAQWVYASADQQSWKELGTGHQCNDQYRYWYWGYGVAGEWYAIGWQANIIPNATHTFEISRAFNGTYDKFYFRIDGTTKASQISSASGPAVNAGLESYASAANVGYNNNALKYQKNGASWVNWNGKDYQLVSGGMCGNWPSGSQWYSGQGSGC